MLPADRAGIGTAISEKPQTIDRSDWIIGPDDQILVTGAGGFVGKKVMEVLRHYGFTKIRCLLRPSGKRNPLQSLLDGKDANRTELVQGNLLSKADCRRAAVNVSVIYHLAAGTEKSFPGCFLNSVVTTRNLLEAAIRPAYTPAFCQYKLPGRLFE